MLVTKAAMQLPLNFLLNCFLALRIFLHESIEFLQIFYSYAIHEDSACSEILAETVHGNKKNLSQNNNLFTTYAKFSSVFQLKSLLQAGLKTI